MAINQAKYEGHLLAQHEITDLIRDQHRQFTSLSDKLRVLADSTHDTFTEDIVSSIDHFLEASNVLTEKAASIFVQQQDAASTMKMTTDKLQNQIMALRMLPISTVFDLFPRAVHDMAKMYNKKVNITITGSDTEVDKKMLEHIKDPLMHLLRNAIDHGIEPEPERKKQGKSAEGTIELSAWQEGDRVFIKVSDDGKGINPATTRKVAVQKGILSTEEAERLSDDEARHLIFQSGFSTSKIITDVSGRGVGVDVVRKNIEDNLGGQVILNSETHKGTVFTLILPLTLAVTPSVIIRLGHQMFAIPASSVLLGTRITASDIQSVEGKQAIRVIDSTVPLVRIAEVLRLPKQNGLGFYADTSLIKETDKFHAIVIEYGHQKLAFLVDELIKEQDIIVKPLEKPLQKLKNIAGVTILEKGEIVPIIHVPELIESAKKALPSRSFDPSIHEKEQKTQQKILIVEDSLTTRELEKSIMTSVGYFVETAVDGIDALNKIATSKPDLIITDIQMPRMDGFRMTEKLKQEAKYKDIPVVMVTALARDAEKKRGIELGADAYITKTDFDQSHLVDIIEQLIG
jgi:two-component system chemotaxis sensor kinase CheA